MGKRKKVQEIYLTPGTWNCGRSQRKVWTFQDSDYLCFGPFGLQRSHQQCSTQRLNLLNSTTSCSDHSVVALTGFIMSGDLNPSSVTSTPLWWQSHHHVFESDPVTPSLSPTALIFLLPLQFSLLQTAEAPGCERRAQRRRIKNGEKNTPAAASQDGCWDSRAGPVLAVPGQMSYSGERGGAHLRFMPDN